MNKEREAEEEKAREFYESLSLAEFYSVRSSQFGFWAPHEYERELLLNLAISLGSKEKPFIVDVGCGTGFIGNLLTMDGGVDVLGVDTSQNTLEVPLFSKDITLVTRDIWDISQSLGPHYNPEISREIEEITLDIKRNTVGEPVFHSHNGVTETGLDTSALEGWKEKVKKLQRLVRQYDEPSLVDMAFCSFMEKYVELTIPIRDTIHPRCIVYVRAVDGNTGAGDYYSVTEHFPYYEDLEYHIMSFSPGDNYKTIARWRTPSALDWDVESNSFDYGGNGAEVIIQLRKDINLRLCETLTVPSYPWDAELKTLLVSNGRWGDFCHEVLNARHSVLSV